MKPVRNLLHPYQEPSPPRPGDGNSPSGAAGAAGNASNRSTARGESRSTRLSHDQDVCPICHGRGFLTFDVPPGDPNFSKAVPCRCTEARLVAERARTLQSVSNIGQLGRMTFEAFRSDGVGLSESARFNLHTAYDLAQEFAQDPRGWLVITGNYGCGKTHLAAAIANHRLSLGHPAMFVVVPDLLDHLRATYAPTSTVTYDERFDSIRESPLLVLDDLGAHNSTPWAQEKLFQILNHRYNSRLPTVITTNQRLEELDPRLLSRLVDPDLSRVYGIVAPDYRQPGAERNQGSSINSWALHSDQGFENFSLREHDLTAEERKNLQQTLNAARSYAENPQGWFVLTGPYGCGKTHLAAAIANEQISHGRPAPVLVVVPDLLDHLRATFSPNSNITLDKAFEQVRTAQLLVLDDLGTESATPWAREKLFQLLNHRYVARLATVITTALGIDKIDERLRTRMLDTSRCKVQVILAPALRGHAQTTATPKPRRRAEP
jgi:DNA replication protein DnaC